MPPLPSGTERMIPSPILWGARLRLFVAAVLAMLLWLAVAWAMGAP